jgi:hypothetical protein
MYAWSIFDESASFFGLKLAGKQACAFCLNRLFQHKHLIPKSNPHIAGTKVLNHRLTTIISPLAPRKIPSKNVKYPLDIPGVFSGI